MKTKEEIFEEIKEIKEEIEEKEQEIFSIAPNGFWLGEVPPCTNIEL